MKYVLVIMVLSFCGLASCQSAKYAECAIRDNTSNPCNW